MNYERLKDFAWGLGFIAVQILLFRHLKVFQMQPDLVLIFVLWLMIRRDRTSVIILAASLGLLQDALLDLWGLNMFAKVLTAFIGFNLIPKGSEGRLLIGQVFLTVFIAAILHNLIFLGLSGIMEVYSAEVLFWRQWIGNSIYTAVVASFIQLFRTG